MSKSEALDWLARLSAKRGPSLGGDHVAFSAWAIEAESLFARVFIPSEPVLLRYREALASYAQMASNNSPGTRFARQTVKGAFEACRSVLEDAPAADLFWKVQVAGSAELLEQAVGILSAGFSTAAAAVLAGGALEQHLLHLCARYTIKWSGQPSIATYNNAIRGARGTQAVPYEEADASQVEAWAKVRNEAAHAPGTFTRGKDEIQRLVIGIRDLVGRVN